MIVVLGDDCDAEMCIYNIYRMNTLFSLAPARVCWHADGGACIYDGHVYKYNSTRKNARCIYISRLSTQNKLDNVVGY